MKILFLERGSLWSYGLPDGLRDLGHTVRMSGPVVKKRLSMLLSSFRPDLLVSVGWGPDHTRSRLRFIRQLATKFKIPLVYWSTEDPNFTDVFTLPLIKRLKPDAIFSISAKTAVRFCELGYPAAYMDYAFHPKVHRRIKPIRKYKTDIAVVANAYPDVLRKYPKLFRRKTIDILIRPLLDSGMKIHFYGRNWSRMKTFLGQSIPKAWIKGHITYNDAKKVYSSAKIMLGLQNYTDMATQRTFEILGSSGFLLTCPTPGVRQLLRPGIDAAMSSSAKETVRLVRYYLNHPKERERVRRQGRKAIARHNYTNRARFMLSFLKKEGLIGFENKHKRKTWLEGVVS